MKSVPSRAFTYCFFVRDFSEKSLLYNNYWLTGETRHEEIHEKCLLYDRSVYKHKYKNLFLEINYDEQF